MLPKYVQFAFEKRAFIGKALGLTDDALRAGANTGAGKWVSRQAGKLFGSRAGNVAGVATDKVAPYAKNWGQRVVSRPKWLGGTGKKVETVLPSWAPHEAAVIAGDLTFLPGMASIPYWFYKYPKMTVGLPLAMSGVWSLMGGSGGGATASGQQMAQQGVQQARFGSGPGYHPSYNFDPNTQAAYQAARNNMIKSMKKNPGNFSMFRTSPLVLSRY